MFPMRRVWISIAARMRTRKRGRGLLKLYNDVQSCGYQDVQVMWEMVQNSEICLSPKRRRSTWRLCWWAAHPQAKWKLHPQIKILSRIYLYISISIQAARDWPLQNSYSRPIINGWHGHNLLITDQLQQKQTVQIILYSTSPLKVIEQFQGYFQVYGVRV